MTMKREAKTEILTRYQERRTGARVERSISPRQCRIFGRTLPARYAARFYLGYERETKAITRELWTEDRASRRVRWTNADGRTVCKGERRYPDTRYHRTARR